MSHLLSQYTRSTLEAWATNARSRTLALVEDLTDAEFLNVPLLRIINPFLWEIGHVAYFQEYWVLRHAAGESPLLTRSDEWYDSAKVAHDTRWNLPLPNRRATVEYVEKVRDKVVDRIANPSLSEHDVYFILLSIFHEDMHDEAFLITRQTLSYKAPEFTTTKSSGFEGSLPGDVTVSGGKYLIGSNAGDGFIFDNEKWAHEIHLPSFRIALAPVTQAEFVQFVNDGGYTRRELWTTESWSWRESAQALQPIYWKRDSERGWMRRHFDQWMLLEPHRPVSNISWFEADAYCRWAGRRLPTEFEWEAAAQNLQMTGNVWEWTASEFLPYPGFSEDPYKEYSSPWFGTHKTLKGSAWSTRSRMIRTKYRNFYTPDRRDIFAGFRTCAIQS